MEVHSSNEAPSGADGGSNESFEHKQRVAKELMLSGSLSEVLTDSSEYEGVVDEEMLGILLDKYHDRETLEPLFNQRSEVLAEGALTADVLKYAPLHKMGGAAMAILLDAAKNAGVDRGEVITHWTRSVLSTGGDHTAADQLRQVLEAQSGIEEDIGDTYQKALQALDSRDSRSMLSAREQLELDLAAEETNVRLAGAPDSDLALEAASKAEEIRARIAEIDAETGNV